MPDFWIAFCALLGWHAECLAPHKRGRPTPCRLWLTDNTSSALWAIDLTSRAELIRRLRYEAQRWLINDDVAGAIAAFALEHPAQRAAVVDMYGPLGRGVGRRSLFCPLLQRVLSVACEARDESTRRYARLPRHWLGRVTALTVTMTGTCESERVHERLRQVDAEALDACMKQVRPAGPRQRL